MRYRDHRYPCDHPTTVHHGTTRNAAVIVNVSTHGARLARVEGLAPGDRIRLDFGAGCRPVMAEVRWVHNGRAGLRLAEALDGRTLAILRKSAPGSTPAPRRGWNLHLRELR